MKPTKAEVAEARESILRFLKPGSNVYTIVRHVSRSGMQREISLYAISKDGRPQWLDGWASKLLDYRLGKNEGLVVGGCGMDMAFHLVYNLGSVLWPKGDGKTVTGRNGTTEPETDGGYLLNKHSL